MINQALSPKFKKGFDKALRILMLLTFILIYSLGLLANNSPGFKLKPTNRVYAATETREENAQANQDQPSLKKASGPEFLFYIPYVTLGFFILMLIFLLGKRSAQKGKGKSKKSKPKENHRYSQVDWEPKISFEKDSSEENLEASD